MSFVVLFILFFHSRAKNEASTFAQGKWNQTYGDGFNLFKEARKQVDPAGLFLNQFAKDLGL